MQGNDPKVTADVTKEFLRKKKSGWMTKYVPWFKSHLAPVAHPEAKSWSQHNKRQNFNALKDDIQQEQV